MLSYDLSGPHTLFEGDAEITCRTLRSLVELVLSWPKERFDRVRIARDLGHDLLPEHILVIAKHHDIRAHEMEK